MLCRYCTAETTGPVLRLGRQPFANSFLSGEDVERVEAGLLQEPALPLDLYLCTHCGLVQIAEGPAPEQLFSEYIYVSGSSDAIHAHAGAVLGLWREVGGAGALVVELASNDGTVLKVFRNAGCRVLGVEPARNVAALATAAGVPTLVQFFGRACAADLAERHGLAGTVLARHVFAHVSDPHEFLDGVRTILGPRGVFMIEAPYLEPFLERTEFDTIYHEHLTYLSLKPLERILGVHGLEVFHVQPYEIHGGSMMYVIGHAEERPVAPSVLALREREARAELHDPRRWDEFATRAKAVVGELRGLLEDLVSSGARVAGYGAPAKGNTLLGCLGYGRETIGFLVDRNPWKQGRFTPGTHIPVRAPEALLAERPDYALLLAWNFEREILEQQAAYRQAGGRFIRPIPRPEVIV